MLKIIGGICIITASGLMGYRCGEKIKEEYRELQYLQQLLYLMQSEIRYARSYLGEVFFHVGGKVKEPYKGWLFGMSRTLSQRTEGLFADIWCQGIEEYLSETCIPKSERLRLSELGQRFTTADIQLQMKTLELYQEQLTLVINEKREEMRTKIRLCHCLGIMGGVFLTVLLV